MISAVLGLSRGGGENALLILVTVTAFFGMVNVVVALFAFANVTPLLAVVQFLNCWPLGGILPEAGVMAA